jgi:hypothetical protein
MLRSLPDLARVRVATADDLGYVVDRMKLHSNRVGFIPRSNLADLLRLGTVWIVTLHAEPAGAIVCSGGIRKPLCFRANLVEKELWEKRLGTALTRFVQTQELAKKWGGVRVRTRLDITPQLRINANGGGAFKGTAAAGARGHAVSEWWLPALDRGGIRYRLDLSERNRSDLGAAILANGSHQGQPDLDGSIRLPKVETCQGELEVPPAVERELVRHLDEHWMSHRSTS